MNAARGPTPSAMNGDDAAGGAFDKLRDVVRKCGKGAAQFDHDHFSKKHCLAPDMTSTLPSTGRMAGPETFREQSGASPKLQWFCGAHSRWTKTANGFDLWTFPLTRCSHFVLMVQSILFSWRSNGWYHWAAGKDARVLTRATQPCFAHCPVALLRWRRLERSDARGCHGGV